MQLHKRMGFSSAAQGRSSPYMGQSQGRTSQFAFYQLDSQHTEVGDSSNPIFFWLFTSASIESTFPFICNSGIMTVPITCWLWGYHAGIFSYSEVLWCTVIIQLRAVSCCTAAILQSKAMTNKRSMTCAGPGWTGLATPDLGKVSLPTEQGGTWGSLQFLPT